jgi:hypothetical protein
MQLVMDTLSQANRENAPSFTDELRRLLIKLSPLKQAEELLRMKISPPQEDGDSQMVLTDSTEFSVRSASGWKQAFNKMRGITAARDEPSFDNGPASILEACAEDMIGAFAVLPSVETLVLLICQLYGITLRQSRYSSKEEYDWKNLRDCASTFPR